MSISSILVVYNLSQIVNIHRISTVLVFAFSVQSLSLSISPVSVPSKSESEALGCVPK